MDDNVMPNDGSYFVPREPIEQVNDRKKEQALALEARDILKEVLSRLEERIAFFESVSSIPDDVRVDPEKFLIIHNAHTLTARALSAEKDMLKSVIEAYKR